MPNYILLARVADTEEMMFDAALLNLWHLVRDNVHASVDLHCVGVDDPCFGVARAGEVKGELNGEIRLADAGSADDDDQRAERGHLMRGPGS